MHRYASIQDLTPGLSLGAHGTPHRLLAAPAPLGARHFARTRRRARTAAERWAAHPAALLRVLAARALRRLDLEACHGQAAWRIGWRRRRVFATRFCSSCAIIFFDVSSVRLPLSSKRWCAAAMATSGCTTASMLRKTKHWRSW